jgi:hypothetical protein
MEGNILPHRSSGFFLIAIFLFTSTMVWGQDLTQARPKRARTFEDYQPSTLKEITALQTESTLLPLQVKVTYTGLTRPLSQTQKDFLRAWANRYAGSVEHYTANYKTEMQFIEAGQPYWLMVTTKSLEQLQSEMKKGQGLELYLIRIASSEIADKSSSLLLVEKFQQAK